MPSSVKSNMSLNNARKNRSVTGSQQSINSTGAGQRARQFSTPFVRLPSHLVPTSTSFYSLRNHIKECFNIAQNQKFAYHIWLDCLYDINVKYDMILSNIQSLFTGTVPIKQNCVFILGAFEDDGSIVPAGSCVIFSSIRFNDITILKNRLHAIKIDNQRALSMISAPQELVLVYPNSFAKFFSKLDQSKLNQAFRREKLDSASDRIKQNGFKHVENVIKVPQATNNSLTIKPNQENTLRKIKNKDEALDVLKIYLNKPYDYYRFTTAGGDFNVHNLLKFINDRTEKNLVHIYFTSKSDASRKTGVFVTEKKPNSTINNDYKDSTISIRAITYGDFRSIIMNYNQTSSFFPKIIPNDENTNSAIVESVEKLVEQNIPAPSSSSTSTIAVQKKPNRIAANFVPLEQRIESIEQKLEADAKRHALVDDKIKEMGNYGNLVIKIQNLPENTPFKIFQIMFGAPQIVKQQVAAVVLPKSGGKRSLDLCIVLKSGDPLVKQILGKDKYLTFENSALKIEEIDLKRLKLFLSQYSEQLYEFKEVTPIGEKVVPYGKHTLV